MRARRDELFATIRTEGGLLPPDLLARVVGGDPPLPGLDADAYHLDSGDRLNEAASRAWTRLLGAWETFQERRRGLPAADLATGLVRDRWLLPLFDVLGYGRLQPARLGEIGGRTFAVSHLWQRVPIHLVGPGVEIDRRTPGVAGAARTSPHGLVQELLNRSDDHLWGFVSNGLRLRLLRDSANLTRQAYVEFDLEAMMDGEVYADFVVLWLVCHESRLEMRADVARGGGTSATRRAKPVQAAGDGEDADSAVADHPEGAIRAPRPEDCWLEVWTQIAHDQGTRALEDLRGGVERAIAALGRGFLVHRRNGELRELLRTGNLAAQDYYRELLRLVYRLLFLLVAEDRGMLLDPRGSFEAGERYRRWYSTARLRRLAGARRGGPHPDLYEGLCLVMRRLGAEDGCAELGLPALGSFLWSTEAIRSLADAALSNRDLLDAIRALAFDARDGMLRPVDFKNLGAEELGSVYESLLELHPQIDVGGGSFELTTAAGSERKTTGSYYTPSSLIQSLLDSALNPVLDEAAGKADAERAILALKVCDPACGSGHFLIAAAHRIARRLAQVRTGDEEPSPDATWSALRDVIGRCIHGVDTNPMAVELCKVSLWLEALEPGKPLSFLDHRIFVGNSLLGTTPALLSAGIPDDAFKPIEGDDKAVVAALRKQNRDERGGQRSMLLDFAAETASGYGSLGSRVQSIDAIEDDSIEGVRLKEDAWHGLVGSPEYQRAKLEADAWCSAFVWRKAERSTGRRAGVPEAVTHDVLERLRRDPATVPAATRDEIDRHAKRYGFFHWHIAFPDVFWVPEGSGVAGNKAAGWSGGFDVVLGNPPWEHTELKEKEWFAVSRPDITSAPTGSARKRMIAALEEEDPALYGAFHEDLRRADGVSQFVRESGRYPLCGRGRINTYAIFAEWMRTILSPVGRVGCILPSGIATDDTTKFFFQDLMESRSLASLYDFENREKIFAAVDSRVKFCLLTLSGSARPVAGGAEFAFFAHRTTDLRDAERRFILSADDIALLNPNTRTCPVFRSRRDAEITKAIYRRVPVLVREGPPEENPWGVSFRQGLFNMTSDSGLFRTRDVLEAEGWELDGNVFRKGDHAYLPLYEAKMCDIFDHRAARVVISSTALIRQGQPDALSVAEHEDPSCVPEARYWVEQRHVLDAHASKAWTSRWVIVWRRVSSTTNERTFLPTILPLSGIGDSLFAAFAKPELTRAASALQPIFGAFSFDFLTRQKLGNVNLSFFIVAQLPVLPPSDLTEATPWDTTTLVLDWILPRGLELTYTSHDLAPFARDCGYDGPPFRWNEERRFHIRCELDAAFFRLYGIARDDVDYILDTFSIVKRHDIKRHGDYRTKITILRLYDEMQVAIDGGTPFRTALDPPPADPRAAHAPTPSGTGRPHAAASHGDARGQLQAIRVQYSRDLDEPDAIDFIVRVREAGILTNAEWQRILDDVREAFVFTQNPSPTALTVDGKLLIDPDADPRNAGWIRIHRAHRLTGHHMPLWATLWLWHIGGEREAGPFWKDVGRVAEAMGFPCVEPDRARAGRGEDWDRKRGST